MPTINLLAVFVCALSSVVLGSLWYGPLFGAPWMKMIGLTQADMEAAKKKGFVGSGMAKSYGLMVLGSLVMAYVLAVAIGLAGAGLPNALRVSFLAWAGFLAPAHLGSVLWEGKSWKLWALNSGYHLAYLLCSAAILASWT